MNASIVSIETKAKNMVESLDEILESEFDTSESSELSKRLQRSQLSLDINDILNLEFDDPKSESQVEGKSNSKVEKVKCCPTIIGGSDLEPGCSRLGKPKTCSTLHCRNCDFPVSFFPNHEWIENVEYIFLRTNMPNFEKLSVKLKKKKGSVAYACHCVSFSTTQTHPVDAKHLPWFCRGHV